MFGVRKIELVRERVKPCLVVMERDSRNEGHGFESRHCILDGHFFTYICCKNCNDVV